MVNAARVSHNKFKDEFDESDSRLLKYLSSHGHASPFFHPQVCLRMRVPIYVARQLLRHEIGAEMVPLSPEMPAPYNEVSRRYVDYKPIMVVPRKFYRRSTEGKKQATGAAFTGVDAIKIRNIVEDIFDACEKAYNGLLDLGVTPEQARIVLPLALETQWIWTGSLEFFARVCRHRLAADVQNETREVAEEIDAIIAPLFPVAWKLALGKADI